MSPWDVLGWLLVLFLVGGASGVVLVPLALGLAVMRSGARQRAGVVAWETHLPNRTEWKSFEHGRATVVIERGRGQNGMVTARLQSENLGDVFGSVPQIAKLLLQRRYRRV